MCRSPPCLPRAATWKLCNVGAGFFVMIFLAAYTANLAAYLGAQPLSDFWATIEQANADGAKICAHSVLQGALPPSHPRQSRTGAQSRTAHADPHPRAALLRARCTGILTTKYPGANFHFRSMDVASDVRAAIEQDGCAAFIFSARGMKVGALPARAAHRAQLARAVRL